MFLRLHHLWNPIVDVPPNRPVRYAAASKLFALDEEPILANDADEPPALD